MTLREAIPDLVETAIIMMPFVGYWLGQSSFEQAALAYLGIIAFYAMRGDR